MNLLVIGSGGREHALCWALSASPLVNKLVCAPGNAGIAQVAKLAPVDPLDLDAVLQLCRDEHVDFVVVGPEAPLVIRHGRSSGGRGLCLFRPQQGRGTA